MLITETRFLAMSKSPSPKKAKSTPSRAELEAAELDPKAWPKFEALMKAAAKMGHTPHKNTKKKTKTLARGRGNA